MKLIKSKKGILALVAAAVVGVAAFGAYAYFTNSGTTTGTPVAVGDQSPDFAVALQSAVTGTGVAASPTTYGEPNCTGTCTPVTVTKLVPAALGDQNAVVATVPLTITNGSEGQELLSTYTITLSGSNQPDTAIPACTSADFAVNGVAYTAPVVIGHTQNANLPLELKHSTDAPANSFGDTFTVQLLDPNHNQDNCENWQPTVTVDAAS
jgi:hypothetical protein